MYTSLASVCFFVLQEPKWFWMLKKRILLEWVSLQHRHQESRVHQSHQCQHCNSTGKLQQLKHHHLQHPAQGLWSLPFHTSWSYVLILGKITHHTFYLKTQEFPLFEGQRKEQYLPRAISGFLQSQTMMLTLISQHRKPDTSNYRPFGATII